MRAEFEEILTSAGGVEASRRTQDALRQLVTLLTTKYRPTEVLRYPDAYLDIPEALRLEKLTDDEE
jgi:hypothetical protein